MSYKFKHLKIGTKQILGFGTVLAIMIAANFHTMNKMIVLKDEIDEVSTNWMPRTIAIASINTNVTNLRIQQLQHALVYSDSLKHHQAEQIIALIDRINENRDTYEALKAESEATHLYSQREGELYDQFDELWESYLDLSFQFIVLSRENQRTLAIALLNDDAQTVFHAISQTIERLVKINQEDAASAVKRAELNYNSARHVTKILLLISVLCSLLFAYGIIRLISIPVQQLAQGAKEVAAGNLDININVGSQDEIGDLAHSFNMMTASLREARTTTEMQADELRAQQETLQETNEILEERNVDLERALLELKNTQDQLIVKEKMAALGDLVAGIAHELNNPLGAMNSLNDVSRRCVHQIRTVLADSSSVDEIRQSPPMKKALTILEDNLRVSDKAGHRLSTIVKSLKNFVRLDESEYQRVDIHEGLENTLVLLENEIRGRIEVVKKFSSLPKLSCYPGQLNQVFITLIKNAIAAHRSDGKVTIQTLLEDNNIVIKISDTGKGIPPERLKRLFELGFSSDGARIKMGGAGLSTAYAIIQKHHGDIQVESVIGQGTTFTITLPRQ